MIVTLEFKSDEEMLQFFEDKDKLLEKFNCKIIDYKVEGLNVKVFIEHKWKNIKKY